MKRTLSHAHIKPENHTSSKAGALQTLIESIKDTRVFENFGKMTKFCFELVKCVETDMENGHAPADLIHIIEGAKIPVAAPSSACPEEEFMDNAPEDFENDGEAAISFDEYNITVHLGRVFKKSSAYKSCKKARKEEGKGASCKPKWMCALLFSDAVLGDDDNDHNLKVESLKASGVIAEIKGPGPSYINKDLEEVSLDDYECVRLELKFDGDYEDDEDDEDNEDDEDDEDDE